MSFVTDLLFGADPPPAPDYKGAAEATAQGSKEAINAQTWANRANQYTPWGASTWSPQAVIDPATGQTVSQWSQQTALNPMLQGALDSQLSLQLGRSELGNQLMGRAWNEFQAPMNWSQFGSPTGVPSAQNLRPTTSADMGIPRQTTQAQGGFNFGQQTFNQPSLRPTTGLQNNLQQTTFAGQGGPQVQNINTDLQRTPTLQGNVQGINYNTNLMQAPQLQANMGQGTGNIQRSLNFGGLPSVSGGEEARKAAEEAMMAQARSRLDPMFEQRRQEMERSLANRGIAVNSEAYSRAMADFDRSRNDAYNQAQFSAIQNAGQEAQRVFGMDLGRRQQFGTEIMNQGNFANTAQQQAFGQNIAAGQANNAARAQQFGLGMDARQAQLAAQQAQFGQNMQRAQFGNQAAQDQFGMGSQALQQQLAAQQARFGQQLQGNQFWLGRQQQAFGQQQAMDQAALQRQQQAFGQQQTGQQMDLARQQQIFGQQQNLAQFGLGQQQQSFAQAMGRQAQLQALQQQAFQQQGQAGAQNFDQQMRASQYANQLRSQAIQEAMQQRGFSLNEINALIAGQQVAMPQFQGYNTAGAAQGPNYLGAANMQYSAGLDAYNAQAAQMGNLINAGSQAAMMFSDARVKTDIRREGRDPRGWGIYSYRYIGERGRRRGVIAQDVRRVAPELVAEHNGVLRVNVAAFPQE